MIFIFPWKLVLPGESSSMPCMSNMASDESPQCDDKVKVRRRRREQEVRRKEVLAVDIEELTSAGHRALQEGRTQDALSCFNKALNAAGQDWSLAAQGFLRAAESYRVAAMLDSAAAAFKEAVNHMIQSDRFSRDDINSVLTECLSLTDRITEPRILGELYLSVGVSYCRLRCFQEAVQCFQLALGPTTQHPSLLAKVLHNLGAALNSVGQFTPAVGYHRLAAGLYGSLGRRGDQARCFSNLAFACSQLGDEEEAAESFIHALQGFRDAEDHLAQAQVCESLAECYLKQRKQQKAVQLYKQALTALSHCQDSSGCVRDRLVERLTAVLQQSLTVSLQRPIPPGLHPHSPPVRQRVRKSDITQSPGRASKQHPDDERGEGQGTEQQATGRREAAENCGPAGGGATERQEFMNVVPGSHSSHLSEQLQHGELCSDGENLHTDSETSLVQNAETPPTRPDDIREATPPVARWRSRFCSLM
ncbi:tetratricopeptide repeat protein 24 isoform X3 [Chelmon rostratus]|uniref:tetratricopeptide repeat protein 24 isoform X3 n=1 Tax=Chelmon rostratus TaxID=109905 RepID=UPI001BE75281|nr:tetratricopeptide repeat protein 24 isoform X3 [Chelmon rostratus]